MDEVEFLLLYHIRGMSPERVAAMGHGEQVFWLKRLGRELRDEAKRGACPFLRAK